ncbi:MAG: type I-C CRISPR-associated protein Cas8c/Csd1 [Chloroflexota bacterium]
MLLQRLVEYAGREGVVDDRPTLYNKAPIRYIIELTPDGRPASRRPVDTADATSPATRRGEPRLVPQVTRAQGIKPLLLADNAEYTLQLAREASRPERVAACHRAYLELLQRCAEVTGEPAVQAVQRFLAQDPAGQLEFDTNYDRGASVVFRVGDVFPVDLPSVRQFWADENDPARKSAPHMQCIVCGNVRPVLERLQGKIKGVPGGQTSGTSIISANSGAFESYGLQASLVAPTCASCGEKFTRALNALLSDRSHRLTLGNAAFIFWTRQEVSFDFLTYMTTPDSEQVRAMLASLRSGKESLDVDATAFYATVLSGSGARVVVRDWIDTTVGEAQRHLQDWFGAQEIVTPYGERPRPLGLFQLAGATVRDPSKDLTPEVPRSMVRTALTGVPLPQDLLFQAVRRNRAEGGVTHGRAMLTKMVLVYSGRVARGRDMVGLDETNIDPAYRCGRLLAVLEEIQRRAVQGVKATVVDRYFGTASSAPASVFGRLMRGAQPHLSKLERDRHGTYVGLQAQLEDVLSGLTTFPRTLTLTEQGLFSLGYYHQRAHNRAQAHEAIARRNAAGLVGTTIDLTVSDALDLEDRVEEN